MLASQPSAGRPRLGEMLVETGLITADILEGALEAQRSDGRRLGTHLVMSGHLTPDELTEALGRQLRMDVFAGLGSIQADAVQSVPRWVAVAYSLLPVRRDGPRITVAVSDPFDREAVEALRVATGLEVELVIAPELVIAYGVRWAYEHYTADAARLPAPQPESAAEYARSPVWHPQGH